MNTPEKSQSFKKIVFDMMNDLMTTFPELEKSLNDDLMTLWKYGNTSDSNVNASTINIIQYCEQVFPKRFFDILYQNEDMFANDDYDLHFLPGIDYKLLWKENLTEHTRETIWKYLQLILFSTVSNVSDNVSFGDTANLFKAIDEEDFKIKLEETMENMKTMFSNIDPSGEKLDDLPSAESVHDHISSMMEGKLGALAKEIAEETASDLNLDITDSSNVNDVFVKLLKDPSKLMKMVKNVGTKLDAKIKSGDIKESELLEEASEMMKKMKEMPGMENIQSILNKMGLGNKGKINHAAMQSHMERNIRMAQQKERLRSRIGKTENQSSMSAEEFIKAQEVSEKTYNELMKDTHESVFTSGPKPERSSVSRGKKKKDKKK
jgi:hypothetical protein